jgi:DNA-binding transcriptional LysR family regulator
MPRENLNDLLVFLAVARVKSFTKAAAQLGVSQSALSHTIRQLEARLGYRLLTRTTRSVSPTEAGDRLIASVGPHFEEIETALDNLSELRDKPIGTIRITAAQHGAETALYPRLEPFLKRFPDIRVEVAVQYGLTDIAAERFDAGIRLGEQVEKDMVAVRIGPELRMAVVATPAYFEARSIPKKPQELTEHNCINLRLPTHGGLLIWEFEKARREVNVRVDGQLVFNTSNHILRATLAGLGVAFLPEDMVLTHIEQGRLQRVLGDWCAPFSGYHLYYASRRQTSPAFALLVDALRYKG